MTPSKKKSDITASLDKLERIIAWFDEQESVQVEAGLEKVREGAKLVKELRGQLKEVENEFTEVKHELDADSD
jgi:exonuclease VII small subunit